MRTATEEAAISSEVARLVDEIRAGTLTLEALAWRAKAKNPNLRRVAALVAMELEDVP